MTFRVLWAIDLMVALVFALFVPCYSSGGTMMLDTHHTSATRIAT